MVERGGVEHAQHGGAARGGHAVETGQVRGDAAGDPIAVDYTQTRKEY